MNSPKRKSILSKTPAWILSIVTASVSLFLPFLFVGIVSVVGMLSGITDEVMGNFIAYLCTGVTVAFMCFLICKAHTESVWYVPILCNVITLWSGFGNYLAGSPFFNELLPFGIGWILSIIATLLGTSVADKQSGD